MRRLLWAKRAYLDAGRCNDACWPIVWTPSLRNQEPGFQYPDLDNAVLMNQDYYVAKQAFLRPEPLGRRTPNDDPNQPPGTAGPPSRPF